MLDEAAEHGRVDEVSLGDYVLNGGEVAVLVDRRGGGPAAARRDRQRRVAGRGVARRGVGGLLEAPGYTKPAAWRGRDVPDVLLSGDHARIARWRRDESLRRTAARRPDLLARARPGRARPRRPRRCSPTSGWAVGPTDGRLARVAGACGRLTQLLRTARAPATGRARPHGHRADDDNSTPTPWVTCGTAREETPMQTLDALDAASKRSDIPDFRPGDTLKVHVKVIEGTRSRIQVFQGVAIRRQGAGVRETFTVRKVSFGVGVERTFPVHTPVIDKIEVVTRGDVRRAKLYYLRELRGKAAKIKERRDTPVAR